MARKKIEPITSLANEDKLTVQKSLPLFSLWRSNLSLAEFKILDTYLSRINSHNPKKRAVIFEKGELEKILGVKKINNQDLKDRLKNLMGNVIEVPDSSVKRGFRLVTLFEEASAEQDDYGLWQVKLECTQKAMKYFFNIENLGYLRYKLRCITCLTSRYTYIMFIYLESNRYRKAWDVSIDELKQVLNCDKEETYKQFKRFNDLVLKKVQKEMLQKTECRYSYTPIKKGRSVVAVHFEVETLNICDDQQVPGQLTLEDLQGTGQRSELWENNLKDSGFSPEQINQLRTLIETVPVDKLPDMGNGVDIDRYHYIRQLWARLNAQKKPVKDKFAYLCRIIEKDSK